jgi:antitoxin Phd
MAPAPRKRKALALDYPIWKLEDAKAKFSEVVRRARTEGPQRVTLRGKDAVVIVAVEELDRLAQPRRRRKLDFYQFIRQSAFGQLAPEREADFGRDVDLP